MVNIEVPRALAASQSRYEGAAGRAWIAALPGLAAGYLDRWELRPDGPPMHGVCALVLPVVRADGTPAVLKLQLLTEESAGEAAALRAWGGRGAVRLLRDDPDTGTMLLERLDPARSLSAVADDMSAARVLAGLLARLSRTPGPPGLRRLGDIAAAMLDRADGAAAVLGDPEDARLVRDCAAAVREVAQEPGDRLLHWDLHYDNVLAPRAPDAGAGAEGRGPWLAIDPKPLVGDPGFEIFPALYNRWDDITATGDVPRAVRRRFDVMTEVLGLDRRRARAWTLGRVLQNTLWEVAGGARAVDPVRAAIARALRSP
ncbi:aminoglycoside phosphotransferase family protein [Streptomyces cuspidosporus]|uniref:Aminoglycoside phosphotransferase family protein n=1 Tax=Streptomyces cuspidosporus TaxID=66882 RepID=A0ABN3G2N5_9ACTN